MKIEQRASGLLVPEQKRAKPSRVYGPLEIDGDSERAEATKAFTMLMNLGACGGRSLIDRSSREQEQARKKAVQFVAELLLGDDVGFEIMC